MSTTRYCQVCRTDVEDAGGYCLLGHSLSVSALTSDLAQLRDEVDRAFDEAEVHVHAALAPLGAAHLPSQSTPARSSVAGTATMEAPRGIVHEVTLAAPASRAVPPPPPAPKASSPPRPVTAPTRPALWVEDGAPIALNDPIAAFAPAPRMDWGPEKSGLLRRRRKF